MTATQALGVTPAGVSPWSCCTMCGGVWVPTGDGGLACNGACGQTIGPPR